jgi:hypothetical protein
MPDCTNSNSSANAFDTTVTSTQLGVRVCSTLKTGFAEGNYKRTVNSVNCDTHFYTVGAQFCAEFPTTNPVVVLYEESA